MSSQHHGGSEHEELLRQRFIEQATGIGAREFPHGRIGADDDGSLFYVMATDVPRGVIKIRFAKPTLWIGLDRESAETLVTELERRILELRGLSPVESEQGSES